MQSRDPFETGPDDETTRDYHDPIYGSDWQSDDDARFQATKAIPPRYTVTHMTPAYPSGSAVGIYPDKTRAIQAVQRHVTEQRVEHGELVIITTHPGYYVIQPEQEN